MTKWLKEWIFMNIILSLLDFSLSLLCFPYSPYLTLFTVPVLKGAYRQHYQQLPVASLWLATCGQEQEGVPSRRKRRGRRKASRHNVASRVLLQITTASSRVRLCVCVCMCVANAARLLLTNRASTTALSASLPLSHSLTVHSALRSYFNCYRICHHLCPLSNKTTYSGSKTNKWQIKINKQNKDKCFWNWLQYSDQSNRDSVHSATNLLYNCSVFLLFAPLLCARGRETLEASTVWRPCCLKE